MQQHLLQTTARLTERDRRIVNLLSEHRVLTLTDIALLEFDALDTARQRLKILHRLQVLDRFRPYQAKGPAEFHYVLGEVGALLLAAALGTDVAGVRWRPSHVVDIANNAQLKHTLGVNAFFARLSAAGRAGVGELVEWWPERRCILEWGSEVRPDAYGAWLQDTTTLQFFVEYDRGTESLGRVTAKLDGYRALLSRIGPNVPVLFVFESSQREAMFMRTIDSGRDVFIATAFERHRPADAVWAVPGASARCDLLQIAETIVRQQRGIGKRPK